MKNAFEHVSVEKQLIDKHLLPPFWNFICPKNTGDYLLHLGEDSTITNRADYSENYQNARNVFVAMHGTDTANIPDTSREDVLAKLRFLKESYGK